MLKEFKDMTIGTTIFIAICFVIYKFLKTMSYEDLFQISFGSILTVVLFVIMHFGKVIGKH